MWPADSQPDPASAQAVLQQLVALGYIQELTNDEAKASEEAGRELQYNLACALIDVLRMKEAEVIFAELAARWPEEHRFQRHLAQCQLMLGQYSSVKAIVQSLTLSDGIIPAAGSAPDLLATWANWVMAVVHCEEGRNDEALFCLLRAEAAEPANPDLHLSIGHLYLRMHRNEDANRAFAQALEIDGENARALDGLAAVAIRARDNVTAAEHALRAIALQHFLPTAHYHLGVALTRLEQFSRATIAFETALSMVPGMLNAHRWLAALHGSLGGDFVKQQQHRSAAIELGRQRRLARAVQAP
jgi:tetratricopeptide (TPR) repeat protein